MGSAINKLKNIARTHISALALVFLKKLQERNVGSAKSKLKNIARTHISALALIPPGLVCLKKLQEHIFSNSLVSVLFK